MDGIEEGGGEADGLGGGLGAAAAAVIPVQALREHAQAQPEQPLLGQQSPG